jgi:hypothetical protein
MDNVWIEFPNLPHKSGHHPELREDLSQPRPLEDAQIYGLVQQMQIGCRFAFGKEEEYASALVLCEATSEPNAILAEIE